MTRNGWTTEMETWRGTIFQGPRVRVDCYRLQLTNDSVHHRSASTLAGHLERIGLAAIARWLREGARARDLALAYRTARRLRADPRLAGTVIRVSVSRGAVRIEGRFTPSQSETLVHIVRSIRRSRSVNAAIRVARIAMSRE